MEQNKKPSGHGGARPGAGRPKGSTDKVTIAGLLSAVELTSGKDYVTILAEDFHQARTNNDGALTVKYHNLILNKLVGDKNDITVTDSQEALDAKRVAFAEALAAFASTGPTKD